MFEFQSPLALLALPLAALVWWWYRRRRAPERPATALWLLERGRARGQSRRRCDLRLVLLLTAFALLVLALARPLLRAAWPQELVLVVDASASMAAGDAAHKQRLELAKERAAPWLAHAKRAVLVRAGLEPLVFGPAGGKALLGNLARLRAGDSSADLAAAAAVGRRLLPGAGVLVVSDAAPPLGTDGYLNCAGDGGNVGITALGPRFAAVFNAGEEPWRGELQSAGRTYRLAVPPQRFALVRFSESRSQRRAVLRPGGSLALDDVAYCREAAPRVTLQIDSPVLRRALLALGASVSQSGGEALVTSSAPATAPAKTPTVYFAQAAGDMGTVASLDPTDPLLSGVSLLGSRFSMPTPPAGEGWRTLARNADGAGMLWRRAGELYLPPLTDWRERPQLVVLLYNWLEPLRNRVKPLGSDGVLRPQVKGGWAYSLLSETETNLPRPRADDLESLRGRFELAPWLALLAGLALLAAGVLKPRR